MIVDGITRARDKNTPELKQFHFFPPDASSEYLDRIERAGKAHARMAARDKRWFDRHNRVTCAWRGVGPGEDFGEDGTTIVQIVRVGPGVRVRQPWCAKGPPGVALPFDIYVTDREVIAYGEKFGPAWPAAIAAELLDLLDGSRNNGLTRAQTISFAIKNDYLVLEPKNPA